MWFDDTEGEEWKGPPELGDLPSNPLACFYLEVAGERIELLSQEEDGLNEPLTDQERLEVTFEDFRDALGEALNESYKRGGVPVDVMCEGKVQATVQDRCKGFA